jgi:hypothetical protein
VQLSGPTGSQTSVHSHPGAEVYYVLTGELTARSDTSENSAAAGQGFVGPETGSAMQVVSTGSDDLLALALFVVDASQAFSSPAEFHAMPGWPNTGAGGLAGEDSSMDGRLLLAILATGIIALGGSVALLKRRIV